MKKKYVIPIALLLTQLAVAQTSWYVNQQAGSDANDGRSPSSAFQTISHAIDSKKEFVQPGDTIFLIGLFNNPSYNPSYSFTGKLDDSHLWNGENSVRINELHATADKYITLKAYDSTTLLKGDGSNILRISNSSYLVIEGFEVYGEVERIPYETSIALQFAYDSAGTIKYRVSPDSSIAAVEKMSFPLLKNVSRPSYTDTRGIYLSGVHHIKIINNHIHHMPGGGIRVSECDYIDIIGNEVDNCTRKSFSGTHGLVVTKATSFDKEEGYKINILRNKVHHNYNEIYSWSPTKTFITPHIDEGKGISLQRNDALQGRTWTHGRILIANNVAYWNGFSGVHSNDGDRVDMINNTCYYNSYTRTVTNKGHKGYGGNIGVSASNGIDVKMINNISVIDGNLFKSAMSASDMDGLTVLNNVIYGSPGTILEDTDVAAVQVNTRIVDPLFTDPVNYDFSLQANSPAIGGASTDYAPANDYNQKARGDSPDLGALEYFSVVNPPVDSVDNVDPPVDSVDNVDPPVDSVDNVDPPVDSVDNVDPPVDSVDNVDPPVDSIDNVDPPILQVRFADFAAQLNRDGHVVLWWSSESRTDQGYYTIERSTDKVSWHELTQIESKGSAVVYPKYETIDRQPVKGKLNYYRLKQTYYGGGFAYSSVRVVSPEENSETKILCFPNPASTFLWIIGEANQNSRIYIYNVSGKDVSGLTRYSSQEDGKIRLDVSSLQDGVYLLTVDSLVTKVHIVRDP